MTIGNNANPIQVKEKVGKLVSMFYHGEISFDNILEMSDTQEYLPVNKVKVQRIIGGLPGWSRESAMRALTSFGIPGNSTLGAIKKNPQYVSDIKHIMDSTPATYRKRIPAPDGWPWFGNIVATLSSLEDVQLPQEITEASRFLLDDEKEGVVKSSTSILDYDDIVGDAIPEDMSRDTRDDTSEGTLEDIFGDDDDDPLGDIFGDGDDDDSDDPLDDLFGV